MKRKNTTRNALFTSIISLLLCVSMLVGTTFAWFTDSVESGLNRITAGNLDVELYHGKTTAPTTKVNSTTVLFTNEKDEEIALWEPGVMAYTNLKIANEGSLALRYQMAINVSASEVDGKSLKDVLKVAVVPGGFTGGRVAAQGLNYNYSLSSFAMEGKLQSSQNSDVFGIVIYWEPTDNDNAYNLKNGVLTAELGVVLSATQLTHENDSFGPDYDNLADMPEGTPEVPSVSQTVEVVADQPTVIESSVASVNLPAGALPADVTNVTLKIDEASTDPNVTFESNEGAKTMEISLVDQDGNKVTTLNENSTFTLDIGDNLDMIAFYHKDESIPYTYEAQSGDITFTINNLSPFTYVYKYEGGLGTKEVPYIVDNADDLIEVIAAGQSAVLAADISVDADDTIVIGSGKNIVLDLNGYTLAGVSDQTGSNRNMIDVKGGTLTVKDGAITVAHTGTNMGWNNSTNVFDVTAGGVLNIENAAVKNLGGSDMAFAVHLNNWGEVTLNVTKSTLESTYIPVRVFNSGNDMNNVTIKNSTLNGKYAFWVHNYTVADFGTAEKAEAHKALLNFDIFNGTNNFVSSAKPTTPILYGFTNTLYLTADGKAYDLPVAIVNELENKTIKANGMDDEITLDCAYTFLPNQTKEECEASGYANWHADFVISVDKDVTTKVAGLAGYYSAWCEMIDHEWIAIEMNEQELTAGQEYRLVAGLLQDATVNYGEICEYAIREDNLINGFLCGAYADESMEGVTLTVELRLYEIDENASDKSGVECETDNYLTIGRYTHTFDNK